MDKQSTGWKRKNIALKNLSLWDENPRFPEEYFNENENELIKYFLNKNNLKINDLSKEIVHDFDLPQLEKLVVLELNGKNIVLEGNRRLTAYKLLANPSLTKGEELKKFFEIQRRQITINNDFVLESIVTKDKNQGLRFIDRKHNRGNNEVGWNEPERRNFASRRPNGKIQDFLRVGLANAVKKLDLPLIIKEAVLGRGYVTTFYRIIDNETARNKLNYKVTDDGQISVKNQKIFEDFLRIIIFNVWNKIDFSGKSVNSRSLNKTDAINNYITNLKQNDVVYVDKEIDKESICSLFGDKTINSQFHIRSKQLSTSREYLITSPMYIPDRRINDIYNELRKKLNVDDTPNAVAVLFRVFLECSVDYYIEKNKIFLPNDIKLDGKILKSVDHLELSLAKKDLEEKGILNPTDKDLKAAQRKRKFTEIRRVVAKDNNSMLSVTTFHNFVHNYKTSPIPSELKIYWDNLNDFFVDLWHSLK